MDNIFIALGSNLGNKKENIINAIKILKAKSRILKVSPLYKTEPVYYTNQDWFLNCVVEISADLTPKQLLYFLKSIEKKLGRKKSVKYGPRIIDLDILFYSNRVIKEKNLIVPHPRLQERLFVLRPLSEISPDFMHPVLVTSIKALKKELKSKEKVIRLK